MDGTTRKCGSVKENVTKFLAGNLPGRETTRKASM
jgi:hypothetical protein